MSESEAQKSRPRLLNRLIRPTKPAAAATTAAFCAGVMSAAASARPASLPPNTSCSIGLAIEITAMPAVTLRNSTPHTSQNCGVFQARLRCTWRLVIMLALLVTAGVQPAGRHPETQRATRHHHEIDRTHHHQRGGHTLRADT